MFMRPTGKSLPPERKVATTPAPTVPASITLEPPELKTAIEEFDRKNYQAVVGYCTRAIGLHEGKRPFPTLLDRRLSDKQLAECYRLRARANVQLGKPDDECLGDYSQSILLLKNLTPPSVDVQINLIKDYIARGHAYRRLGFHKLSLEDYALAKQVVEQAIASVSDTSRLKLLNDLKNRILYDEAVAYYQLGKTEKPEDQAIKCVIAANKLLEIKKAIGLAELKNIGNNSGYKVKKLMEDLQHTGGVRLDLENRAEPLRVQIPDEKVENSPETPQEYYHRARLQMDKARLFGESNSDVILADCNRAINSDPNYAEAYYMKGIVYFSRLQSLIDYMMRRQKAVYGVVFSRTNFIEATRTKDKEYYPMWLEKVDSIVPSVIFHFEKALLIQNGGALKPAERGMVHYYLFYTKLHMGKSTTELVDHYNKMCEFMPQGEFLKERKEVIERLASHLVRVSVLTEDPSKIVNAIGAIQDKDTKIALLKQCLDAHTVLGKQFFSSGKLGERLLAQVEAMFFALDPVEAKKYFIQRHPYYITPSSPQDTPEEAAYRARSKGIIDYFQLMSAMSEIDQGKTKLEPVLMLTFNFRGTYPEEFEKRKMDFYYQRAIRSFMEALQSNALSPVEQALTHCYLIQLIFSLGKGDCTLLIVKEYNEIMKMKNLFAKGLFVEKENDRDPDLVVAYNCLLHSLIKQAPIDDIVPVISRILDPQTRTRLLTKCLDENDHLGKKLDQRARADAARCLEKPGLIVGEVKVHIEEGDAEHKGEVTIHQGPRVRNLGQEGIELQEMPKPPLPFFAGATSSPSEQHDKTPPDPESKPAESQRRRSSGST